MSKTYKNGGGSNIVLKGLDIVIISNSFLTYCDRHWEAQPLHFEQKDSI